ncbi:hypothetical protein KAR91_23695 [Candidatus Pacearchaeota archaeon]|nr:hypothetical protein [Candidatus Pacearchaeota archaeon]
MICYYHRSDLDGHCAGAIVKKKYPDCKMVGVDYGDKPDFTEISHEEVVFVVDFSFRPEEMNKLKDLAELHWIDHHKTSIEWAIKTDFSPQCSLLSKEESGCELTWNFFYHSENIPMPKAVRLLGRYDVWDHIDPNTLPFQYGMRMFDDTTPESSIWGNLLFSDDESDYLDTICNYDQFKSIIKTGETVLKYQMTQYKKTAEKCAYEVDFHDLRAIVINQYMGNSQMFESVYDPEKHDIMIKYGIKPGEVWYSLYSTKPNIDTSYYAKKYGGGGHAGASGFSTKCLLIQLQNKKR